MAESELQKFWKYASTDLGLEVATRFEIPIKNAQLSPVILVKNFGGKNGMLIVSNYKSIEPYLKEVFALGFGFATLDEPLNGLQEYDRDTTVDILRDWGWTGIESNRPQWLRECNRDAAI